MTEPVTLTDDQAVVAHELRARLYHFEFEQAAVLIQVPQVPLPFIRSDVARNKGYFAYPPSCLLYLGVAFRNLGIPSRMLDLNYEMLKAAQDDGADLDGCMRRAIDAALNAFEAPFVCVSLMFDSTYPQFRAVCEHIRERVPNACIAAGGVAATADPARVLDDGLADLVFLREAEHALPLFYAFLRGDSPEMPANLAFADETGRMCEGPAAIGGEFDLDIRAEYDELPIADYHNIGSLNSYSRMRGIEVPYATVFSRRGCRARCTFCAVRNFHGKGVRVRGIEGVVDEMAYLRDHYGVRHFDWLDDDLLYDRDGAVALFGAIERRLPDVTWAANNGLIAAAVTAEILEAAQASGCIGYTVGLESGNSEVLRQIRKPTSLPRFFAFAELSQHYPKMFVSVNFILGFPEERFGQMVDSFNAAVGARLDWNRFFTYQPLKNTDLYIAFGGLAERDEDIGAGEEGQRLDFNPVRAGAFESLNADSDILSGYDIFQLDRHEAPSGAQLKEIWFTFNYVANFLRLPALTTSSDIRLRNHIRWLHGLIQAFPDNAAMLSVRAYLAEKLGEDSVRDVGLLKLSAERCFEASAYWRQRDDQFGFSRLISGRLPEVQGSVICGFDARPGQIDGAVAAQ